MKSYILFFILLFNKGLSQEVKKISGAITNDCFGGKVYDNCYINRGQRLFPNQLLYVTKNYVCENEKSEYYEVYFRGKPYTIKSENLLVLKEDINYLKTVDSVTESKLKLEAEKASLIWYDLEMEKSKKIFEKCKINGIAIIDAHPTDESEYTEGTGYNIKFFNTSKKTIKYIWYTLAAYNPVDDLIGIKTIKGVGPIKSESFGEFDFNYIWLTDLVDTIKLKSLKIQYMDGTFKNTLSPKESFLSDWFNYLIFKDNPEYFDSKEIEIKID